MTRPQPLLSPLMPARSLTGDLVQRLTAEILSGQWAPGERLPTEQALVAALGVSRTVVREAVAALRADGLVITRQGVGAFVTDHAARRPFRIDPEEVTTIGRVLDVMELRTSIEVEAAALAAERHTAADLRRIRAALAAMDQALTGGEAAVRQDYDFHLAIARATCNPYFRDFLRYLGQLIIPRQSVSRPAADLTAYLRLLQQEHRAIVAAVAARDTAAARRAMRAHLENSRARYGRLTAGPVRPRSRPSVP